MFYTYIQIYIRMYIYIYLFIYLFIHLFIYIYITNHLIYIQYHTEVSAVMYPSSRPVVMDDHDLVLKAMVTTGDPRPC